MKSLRLHPLALAFLLALVVRVLPATFHYVIGTDEALYLTLAGHLAAGDGFTADGVHPHSEFDPGYPLFAAAIYRLGQIDPFVANVAPGDAWRLELPARLNILLLGSLLAAPVYFLAREWDTAKKGMAWRATLLTATVPALALGVPNFEAASEQLYSLALWMGWLLLWLGLERHRWYWFGLSGVAFGLAHLTRWEGLVSAGTAFVFAIAWQFLQRAGTQALPPRNHTTRPTPARVTANGLFSALALLAGVLLLAGPYALYQTTRTGSVFSTKSIVHQLHGEALASSDPFAWEKAYDNYERVRDNPGLYPPLPVYLWEHRTQTAINYVRNTITQLQVLFTSPTFLFVIWLPFLLLGARKFSRRQNLFLLATCFPVLIFPLSVVDARYLLPLVPAGMLWTARGLADVDDWINRRYATGIRLLRRVAPVTLVMIVLFVICDLAAMFFIPRPTEYRTAGLALRADIPANQPILVRKRQIAFYANLAYDSLPFSDLPGVLAYAEQKGASYFVVDDRTAPTTRPQLAYLLTDQSSARMQVMYENDDGPRVIVYRILR
jgi:hypothetical protein